jgi:hypothetical protein
MTTLTLLSALLALVFLGTLAYALIRLNAVLEAIGGSPTSYLAKLRFGLQAIERETSHLPIAATRVNKGLEQIAAGLVAVDQHLVNTAAAAMRQKV